MTYVSASSLLLIYDSLTQKVLLTGFILLLHSGKTMGKHTDFNAYFSYEDIFQRVFLLILGFVFIPTVYKIRIQYLDIHVDEQVTIKQEEKKELQMMFDSIQDGIIVFRQGKIHFMNDLSNKIFSFLCNLTDFSSQQLHNQSDNNAQLLERKLFYVFDSD